MFVIQIYGGILVTEIFIKHNPYTVETEFKIDGEEIYSESRLLTFSKEKLDIWINEFIPILENELNEDNFKIIFNGIYSECDKLKELFRTYNNKSGCIKLEYIPTKSIDSKLNDIKNLVNLMQDGNFEELKKQEIQEYFDKIVNCKYTDEDTFISNITSMVKIIAEIIQKQAENTYKFSKYMYEDAEEKLKLIHGKLETMIEEKILNNKSIEEDNLYIEDIEHKVQRFGENFQREIDNKVQELRVKTTEWNDFFIKKYPHIAYTDISRVESYIIQEMVGVIMEQIEQVFSNIEIKFEKIAIELNESLQILCKYKSQQELKKLFERYQVEIIKVNEFFECIQNENKDKTNEIKQKLEVLLLDKEKIQCNQDIIDMNLKTFKEEQTLKNIDDARKEFKQRKKDNEKQFQQTFNYEKQNHMQKMQNLKLEMTNSMAIIQQKMIGELFEYQFNANVCSHTNYIIEKVNKILFEFLEKMLYLMKPIEQRLEEYLEEIFSQVLLLINCFVSGIEDVIENKVYIEDVKNNLEYLDNITNELINALEL